MMIYSIYTRDLVRVLESASSASCKTPATFIDSIRSKYKELSECDFQEIMDLWLEAEVQL